MEILYKTPLGQNFYEMDYELNRNPNRPDNGRNTPLKTIAEEIHLA